MAPFTTTRLNSSTFRILEHDIHNTHPQLYLKLYDSLIVLINTGSGGGPPSLREHLETTPIPSNSNHALNPNGALEYILICTCCHFNHTGATSQFPTSTLAASSNSLPFLHPSTLPTHSLAAFTTPPTTTSYTPTVHLEDTDTFPHVSVSETPLTILHTPGFTPDSLCLFDPVERVLFTGAMLHEAVPVSFPLEANLQDYVASLEKLLLFVREENEGGEGRVVVAPVYGEGGDAEMLVVEGRTLLDRVLRGEVEEVDVGESRGGRVVDFKGGRASFRGPRKVFEDGRRAVRL